MIWGNRDMAGGFPLEQVDFSFDTPGMRIFKLILTNENVNTMALLFVFVRVAISNQALVE